MNLFGQEEYNRRQEALVQKLKSEINVKNDEIETQKSELKEKDDRINSLEEEIKKLKSIIKQVND